MGTEYVDRDRDGDTSAVASSARSDALSFARDMIRPGPDADPEATARALIRLARFILPGDAS